MSLKQTHWDFNIKTSSKICLLLKTLSCHCSRLTSCTWMSRRIDSLISKVMRINELLHWWWVSLKQTHCWDLLIKIKTSCSFKLISLIVQQIRRISCESEWTINSLIFDLVEWFQSFVYTRWSTYEWRKMSAAAWT